MAPAPAVRPLRDVLRRLAVRGAWAEERYRVEVAPPREDDSDDEEEDDTLIESVDDDEDVGDIIDKGDIDKE